MVGMVEGATGQGPAVDDRSSRHRGSVDDADPSRHQQTTWRWFRHWDWHHLDDRDLAPGVTLTLTTMRVGLVESTFAHSRWVSSATC